MGDNVKEFKTRDAKEMEQFFHDFAETFEWGTHFILMAYTPEDDAIQVGALAKDGSEGTAIWLGILDIAKDHIRYGSEEED